MTLLNEYSEEQSFLLYLISSLTGTPLFDDIVLFLRLMVAHEEKLPDDWP